MPDYPSRNLTLSLGAFGPITFQPEEYVEQEASSSRVILFPDEIRKEEFEAAIEWVANTDAPVFCNPKDVKRFERVGFGAYRFNVLKEYHELGFEQGTLKFFPSVAQKKQGVFQWLSDLSGALGWSSNESFHVVAKGRNGESTLYLSSPYMDRSEWAVLLSEKPTRIFGSPRFSALYWLALSEKIGSDIKFFARNDSAVSSVAKIFANADGQESQNVFNQTTWVHLERGSGPSSLLL